MADIRINLRLIGHRSFKEHDYPKSEELQLTVTDHIWRSYTARF